MNTNVKVTNQAIEGNVIVSDPIGDASLQREGDFTEQWARIGEEMMAFLAESDEPDSWININATVAGESYRFNRTVSNIITE